MPHVGGMLHSIYQLDSRMSVGENFRRFVLPESQLSLKLVFDNVRNYFITGAFLAMTLWFQSGKAVPPPVVFN